jgi:hypothetical protein
MLAIVTLYVFTVVGRIFLSKKGNYSVLSTSIFGMFVRKRCMSVGLHACKNLRTTEWIFIKLCIGEFYQKFVSLF